MVHTEYGFFSGDSWQRICKICFLQKYDDTHYLEMVASPGDYGLEGFTKSGKAFQCYCPDNEYTADELFQKQRDKITKDIGKLSSYESELIKRLGDTKINTWYFVTPRYSKNEILSHCAKKTQEIKGLGLSIIDNTNFNIIPTDIDFLHPFLKTALDSTNQRLLLNPKEEITVDEINNYSTSEDYLSQNAFEKHSTRLNHLLTKKLEVEKAVHKTIQHFLNGNNIIKLFRDITPIDFEKFKKIVSQEEDDIEDLCYSTNLDNNRFYIDIKDRVSQRISTNFPTLDDTTIKDLTNYVIADWILRCPLTFSTNNEQRQLIYKV